jgi:predicted AAA+ superfamily ATPase
MIIEALSEWNHWWKEKSVEKELIGNERDILKELIKSMEVREVKIITGIRRSGKSTLFYQLINSLLNKGVEPEHILLINFEDDVLSRKPLKDVFDSYQSNVNPDRKPYLFIDEVHRCPDWVLFLRKLYDLKKIKQAFITDSTSKFIKPEYASAITGRNVSSVAYPLSFREYLKWMGIRDVKIASREEINKIRKLLTEYLRWGGFPEVVLQTSETHKKKLLGEYFNDIIHKDIVERYNINYTKIKYLADYILANSSHVFSPRKYSRTYKLSLESINTYIKYFEDVFLFFTIPKFSYSVRSQQISQKKVYVCDTGFFKNIGFAFSRNLGKIYENMVFIELKMRGKEVYYWKNKYECDFIIKEGAKIKEAIQVCYDLNEDNRERETKGLDEAMDKLRLKEGFIITEDFESEERHAGKNIRYIPLWRWLLGDG